MAHVTVEEPVITFSGELLKVATKPKKEKTPRTEKKKKIKPSLECVYNPRNRFEIGIDEAGRGPLFGRLYVAGVILPKEGSFDPSSIRDSKTLSAKKRKEMSDYIKTHALSYYIHFTEPNVIDRINIRQAVLQGMRQCILETRKQILSKEYSSEKDKFDNALYDNEVFAMVDGDDFTPCMLYEDNTGRYTEIPHETFVGGDNRFLSIAAASILAKVARDEYIQELCDKYPELVVRYGMNTHMGYGTKKHLEGIVQYGITQYHRRSYGCCKNAMLNLV